MALNFTTTNRLGASHGVKCLVYGRAGTGKTTLCGTAPNALILSAEAGLLPLRKKQIPVIEIPKGQAGLSVLTEAYTWLRSSNGHARQITTVCLDSISEVVEIMLAVEKSKTKDGRMAYGDMAERALALIKDFRDLPGKNVVFTAKEASVKSEATGIYRIQPGAPGNQVGPALPYLFDEIFYAGIGVDQTGARYHYLRTQADNLVDAKDRSGTLNEIEYPDLSHIFTKIANG